MRGGGGEGCAAKTAEGEEAGKGGGRGRGGGGGGGGKEGGGSFVSSSTPRSSQGGETNRGKEGDREALPPTPRHAQEGEVKSIILGAGWKCCPRTCFKKKKKKKKKKKEVVAFPRMASIADLIPDFLIRLSPPPLPPAPSWPFDRLALARVNTFCPRLFKFT